MINADGSGTRTLTDGRRADAMPLLTPVSFLSVVRHQAPAPQPRGIRMQPASLRRAAPGPRTIAASIALAVQTAACAGGTRQPSTETERTRPPLQAAPASTASSPAPSDSTARAARFRRMSEDAERRGLAEPFRGIAIGARAVPGLFPIRATGVSTAPVRAAAERFLAGLSPAQRARTTFAVGDDEWRKWMNQHFYARRGVGFAEMSAAQREAAIGLLQASLSAKGLQTTRDIMRLNHTLAELTNDFEQYGEWLYWITLMGTPSPTEPWGWQLDGHHVVINYVVLGDQVVMTPTFMGSEPVTATSGRYAGTRVLQAEQDRGLALINALDAEQRATAIVRTSKTGNDNVGEAFRDNLDLTDVGIRATKLTAAQRAQLLDVVAEYAAHLPEGHARIRMDEVRRHLDDTWFAWIGGTAPGSVFYYRIQSPVVLVEFDHQRPVALPGVPRGVPTREHIHTVVRTPNGNDYGKDLLRQHYERHPHPHGH